MKTSTYTLKISAKFSGAHILHGYDGPCSRLHGHNWIVEVEVNASELDEIGMGVDFRMLKRVTREIAGSLDHRNLNDIPPFDQLNPTAENIAKWFYQQLQKVVEESPGTLLAVTIWETDTCAVRYTESE